MEFLLLVPFKLALEALCSLTNHMTILISLERNRHQVVQNLVQIGFPGTGHRAYKQQPVTRGNQSSRDIFVHYFQLRIDTNVPLKNIPGGPKVTSLFLYL